MCDTITPTLLAAQPPSPLADALASQLLLCCVLRPVLQLATPEHLNPLCVNGISAALRAHPALAAAAGSSAPKAPAGTVPPSNAEPPPWLQRAARTALREQTLAAAEAARGGGVEDSGTPPPPAVQAALFGSPSMPRSAALGGDDAQRTPPAQRMHSRMRSAFQDSMPSKRGRSVGGVNGRAEAARVASGLSRVSSSHARELAPGGQAADGAERIRSHYGRTPCPAGSAPPAAASDPGGDGAAAHAPALVGAPFGLPAIATSAVSSSIRASDSVLSSVHRSAKMASTALYGMLGKGGAEGRPRDGMGSLPSTPPRTGSHGVYGGLTRLSSSAAASGTHTGGSDSDTDGDSDSDGGEWSGVWEHEGSGPAATPRAHPGQVRVRGELTGAVVYLSAGHFDSIYVGDTEGGNGGLAEQGTRARLRKSLHLRRSVVPAWEVLVEQSTFDAVRTLPWRPGRNCASACSPHSARDSAVAPGPH